MVGVWGLGPAPARAQPASSAASGSRPAASHPAGGQAAGFASYFQSTHGGPVDITGRKFTYDYKTDTFVVSGDAVITQRHSVLTADEADFLRRDRILHAKGHVHIVDPIGEIHASEGTLNLNDESSVLTEATITNTDKSYLLKGQRVQKLVGQRYKVLKGFFTTCGCDPEQPDWSITGQQMEVHLGGQGFAQHGDFNVLNYPLIPLPYVVFPADTDRASGFLGPRLGESGLRGFQMLQPYYIALNKSSDATAAMDVETSQRIGGLGEYRLITGEGDYFIGDAAYYNEDIRSEHNRTSDVIDTQLAGLDVCVPSETRKKNPLVATDAPFEPKSTLGTVSTQPQLCPPRNRFDIIGMTREHLTPNLMFYGDGLSTSDSLELRELNVWTLSRTVQPGISYETPFNTMRNAASDLGLIDSYDEGFGKIEADWNQDLIQPQKFALQALPTALLSGRQDLLGGLAYTDYDIEADNFWRVEGYSGQRVDVFPRVTVPWRLGSYLYGWGTLGLRETFYGVGGDQINVIPVGTGGREFNNGLELGPVGNGGFHSRELIYGSAGVGTEVEKVYDVDAWGIEKLKHTLEPFATYAYVPNVNQSASPFYDQIDRVEPRSLFTYGVTSHFYAKLEPSAAPAEAGEQEGDGDDEGPSFSPFRARSYTNGNSVVELLRLTLLQAYDTNHAIAKGASRFADLDMNATAFPTSVWAFGGGLGYSPVTNGIRNADVTLSFQPWWINNQSKLYMGKAATGSFLQLSYLYIAPGPNTAQPGQSANLSEFISGRVYYDLFDRLGLYFAPSYDFVKDKMISAEYGVRIKSPCDCWSFDTGITKTVNPSETQYQFQLTLGGLGSIGQSPFGRNPFQHRTSVLPNYGQTYAY